MHEGKKIMGSQWGGRKNSTLKVEPEQLLMALNSS